MVLPPPDQDARQSTSAFDEYKDEERQATQDELTSYVNASGGPKVLVFAKPYMDATRVLSRYWISCPLKLET